MANDGKLYIIVTDKLPGGMNVTPGAEGDKKQDKSQESTLAKFAQHKFFNLIESQTKQAIQYSINNIGNFTGDYVKQQHVQDVVNVINTLTDVGIAAVAGAKYGPWGAVIGASVAIIAKGITFGEQLIAGYAQNALQNRQIAQLRTRAGLNSTNNGSRGTEY